MNLETTIFVLVLAGFIWAVVIEWWTQRLYTNPGKKPGAGAAAELRAFTEEQASTSPVECSDGRWGLPQPSTHPTGQLDLVTMSFACAIVALMLWVFW